MPSWDNLTPELITTAAITPRSSTDVSVNGVATARSSSDDGGHSGDECPS